MKRRLLVRHLETHGCELRREGSRHSIYTNPKNGRSAPVPRHNEVSNVTAARRVHVAGGVVDEAEEDGYGLFREGEAWGKVALGLPLLLWTGTAVGWPLSTPQTT